MAVQMTRMTVFFGPVQRESSTGFFNPVIPIPISAQSCNSDDYFRHPASLASSKGIQESLGFWIQCFGFRIPSARFQSLSMELGSWILILSEIPNSLSYILDSTSKISPDSGIPHLNGTIPNLALVLL